MKDLSARWLREVKPLPAPRVARALIVIAALLLISVDLPSERFDLTAPRGWAELLVPYLPLVALLFGTIPASIAWFVTEAVLLGLGAGIYQLAQFVFPTCIVMAFCTFLFPWRQAVVLSLSAAATLPLFLWINPEIGSSILIVLVLLCVSAAVGFALSIYQERSRRSMDEMRAMRERQESIRHEERRTLAHELHDVVAHEVTIIAMQARRAALVTDPAKAGQILESIGASAQQALNDLRSLVLILKDERSSEESRINSDDLLRTPEVSGETSVAEGFIDDLNHVVEALRQGGFAVELAVAGDVARVPASLRQALRRTIREMGTNVLKHADPSDPVDVKLTVSEGWVTVSMSNSIAAARSVVSSRTGIEAMRARCEVFHGSVEYGDAEGCWTTKMSFPLEGPVPVQGERGRPE
ncbi:two-component sensor histidine kinase [Leucobacter sp. wl10]|nr:two-component sensor histidine kinase [Leucobacter sp. wl10]